MNNWIVIAGNLIDSIKGGGFEFFGPVSEREALNYADKLRAQRKHPDDKTIISLQLLKVPQST